MIDDTHDKAKKKFKKNLGRKTPETGICKRNWFLFYNNEKKVMQQIDLTLGQVEV